MLDAIRDDMREAWRALVRSRRFASWVIGSLAIGMAVAIAALAFINTILFLPFPGVTDQERLVRITVSRNCGRPDCWTRMSSAADHRALEEGLTGVRSLTAYTMGDVAVALPAARSMRGVTASANYFDVLGVGPAAGRLFESKDAEARAAIAVISHRVWTRELGEDPSVIGRSIRVADTFVEIVGVAPESFVGIDLRPARGDRGPDIWLPIWLADRVLPLTEADRRRGERDLSFVGRLEEGVTIAELRTEARVVAPRLAASGGQSAMAVAEVVQVGMTNPRNRSLTVALLMPIPILVLVIACVNAANLMLARGSERQREIAIRLAIGAGRVRVIRQMLIESALLSLAASAVALPIAWWALELAGTPLSIPVPIDRTVLALTLITAAVTAMTAGLAPALRVSAQRPSFALGSASARMDAGPRQSRMRRLVIGAQVALSIGLMATAWQLVSTVRAQAVSGGTPADRLLIARFDLRPLNLTAGDMERFYGALASRAARLIGVEAAGLARPASVWTFGQGAAPGSIRVWRSGDRPEDGHVTIGGYAGGELFAAVGLAIVQGRPFSDSDRQTRPQVAVVNQSFAGSMREQAVGSVLRVAARDQDFRSAIEVRIVGVIEPSLEPRLTPDGPPAAKVYLPSPIVPEPALALYARTREPATSIAQPVRELVNEIDPRVPILEIGSLDEFNERSFGPQLWLARAAAFLGVIGLLLATAGLYGVSSYVVAMRTREIAIRMAIGADPRIILTMIVNQWMRVALVGLVAGVSAALAISRVIQSEYHGIHGIDGTAFGGAVALFLGAMLLASAVPAVRASRVDPVERLKEG